MGGRSGKNRDQTGDRDRQSGDKHRRTSDRDRQPEVFQGANTYTRSSDLLRSREHYAGRGQEPSGGYENTTQNTSSTPWDGRYTSSAAGAGEMEYTSSAAGAGAGEMEYTSSAAGAGEMGYTQNMSSAPWAGSYTSSVAGDMRYTSSVAGAGEMGYTSSVAGSGDMRYTSSVAGGQGYESFGGPYPQQGSFGASTRPFGEYSMGDNLAHNETGGSTMAGMERINAAAPDYSLVQEYQTLMGSKHFKILDQVANSTRSLTLRDSSHVPDQPVQYHPSSHEIDVPLYHADKTTRRPSADVRADILWEIHNACNRDMFERLGALNPRDPGLSASHEDMEKYKYNKAVYALGKEWFEWSLAHEFDLRCQMINKEMGKNNNKSGDYVTRRLGGVIKKWDQFTNYIGGQIDDQHTTAYDPSAAHPDWIGKQIVREVYAHKEGREALQVRESVIKAWLKGSRPNIKNPDKNPFIPLFKS